MVIYKKVCGICGSEFNGGAPNAKYCSEACKKEAKRRSQRKFWKKQNKPWFQQDVGYNSGDPSDARVPDSKDPSGRKPSKVTRETKPSNPDSKDPQGSGDIPAGSSEGPGVDIVNPDSKDPQGHLSKTWLPGMTDDQVLKELQADQADAGLVDQADVGSQNLPAGSSGDPSDARVPDSRDPSGRKPSKVTRETKPSNPDSKDPQGSGDIPAGSQTNQISGDIPAGSSEGPGDDIVNPDSKDLLEPGDLTLFNIPSQGAIKDPLESGDLPAGSQDLQGSGDLPAGNSGDPSDDRVPDSKDPSGRELSKVTRETKPSNPDSKGPQGSGDIPADSKQSFLDDFFEWLGI